MKMKLLGKLPLLFLLIVSTSLTFAEILVYPFTDPVKEERFNVLIAELRCPKCQNNNLADSNAPLAVDLKDIVYDKINAGESDEDIIFYLKERYGDFISYRPPVKPSTWLIWYGPFVFLLIGAFFIYRFVAGRQKAENATVVSTSSVDSKDLLDAWTKEATTDTGTKPSAQQDTEQENSK